MTDASEPRLIVALDFDTELKALDMAGRLDPDVCRVKVGSELFTRAGPSVVSGLQRLGFEVFLDLKFHDIPNTVAAACRAAADLGVWMANVHALGGERMMRAAAEAVSEYTDPPRLIAVTVLTSMDADDLRAVGLPEDPASLALALSEQARRAGLDGVVCSAREAAGMRRAMGPDWLIVTPGIRGTGAAADDQRRTMTAAEALAAGANYLVVGRPVILADDPGDALRTLARDAG